MTVAMTVFSGKKAGFVRLSKKKTYAIIVPSKQRDGKGADFYGNIESSSFFSSRALFGKRKEAVRWIIM